MIELRPQPTWSAAVWGLKMRSLVAVMLVTVQHGHPFINPV